MTNIKDKFENLKKTLFSESIQAIEDFLGYELTDPNESKDVIEKRLDMAYEQMPDEELEQFFKKYNIC